MSAEVNAPQAAAKDAPRRVREHFGLELLAVLGVSLGFSGITAVLSLIRSELTTPGGISGSTQCIECVSATTYPLLDLADQLADLLHGLVPPLLALVLLARQPGGPGFGVGFDFRRFLPRRAARSWPERLNCDSALGIGFLALIGIPGLALVYVAHRIGANASLQVVSFPDVWYRIPYLLASAFQNGFSEEIIVVGYMLTRLRMMGWSRERSLIASATLRGSYHLYQGFGGFAGNFVMGLIFGWWFQRTNRVLPLVIAHFLIDAVSFVGYLYLHQRLSWI